MSNKLIPKPRDLPAVVAPDVGGTGLSDRDIDKACASLNLVRFSSKTIKALKVVGSALDNDDVAKIMATKILITQEKLQDLLQQLDDVIRDNQDDPQSVIECVRAATAICAENNRASELAVKMLSEKMLAAREAGEKQKFRSFRPGEIIQPVQINIRTDGEAKVEAAPQPAAE